MDIYFNRYPVDELLQNYSIFYGMYVGSLFEYHCYLVKDPHYPYPLICDISREIVINLKQQLQFMGEDLKEIEKEVDKHCYKIFQKNDLEDIEIIYKNLLKSLL